MIEASRMAGPVNSTSPGDGVQRPKKCRDFHRGILESKRYSMANRFDRIHRDNH